MKPAKAFTSTDILTETYTWLNKIWAGIFLDRAHNAQSLIQTHAQLQVQTRVATYIFDIKLSSFKRELQNALLQYDPHRVEMRLIDLKTAIKDNLDLYNRKKDAFDKIDLKTAIPEARNVIGLINNNLPDFILPAEKKQMFASLSTIDFDLSIFDEVQDLNKKILQFLDVCSKKKSLKPENKNKTGPREQTDKSEKIPDSISEAYDLEHLSPEEKGGFGKIKDALKEKMEINKKGAKEAVTFVTTVNNKDVWDTSIVGSKMYAAGFLAALAETKTIKKGYKPVDWKRMFFAEFNVDIPIEYLQSNFAKVDIKFIEPFRQLFKRLKI